VRHAILHHSNFQHTCTAVSHHVNHNFSTASCLQVQTATRSWRHPSKTPPQHSPACTPPPHPSPPSCQMQCSTAPWEAHQCPCPCDPTVLRCQLFLKPTRKPLPTITCPTRGIIRPPSPAGTPHTHGYLPPAWASHLHPLWAPLQVVCPVCDAVCMPAWHICP